MELTILTIGLLGFAFAAGGVLGWLLKKPASVIVESPDRQRETVLFEAQHKTLLEDMESHLAETSVALQEILNRNENFSLSLRDDKSVEQSTVTENSELPIMPARDYSDARGQLNN